MLCCVDLFHSAPIVLVLVIRSVTEMHQFIRTDIIQLYSDINWHCSLPQHIRTMCPQDNK